MRSLHQLSPHCAPLYGGSKQAGLITQAAQGMFLCHKLGVCVCRNASSKLTGYFHPHKGKSLLSTLQRQKETIDIVLDWLWVSVDYLNGVRRFYQPEHKQKNHLAV